MAHELYKLRAHGTLTFDLWSPEWVTWPGAGAEYVCLFWSLYTFAFLNYATIKCRFRAPVAKLYQLEIHGLQLTVGRGEQCKTPSKRWTDGQTDAGNRIWCICDIWWQ